MALQKEMWSSELQKLLWADNSFYSVAKDDTDAVNYKTVHIANAGAAPTTVVDKAFGALTPAQRTDTETTYTMKEISTSAVAIQLTEEQELNYNKRADILESFANAINEKAARIIMYAWSATDFNKQTPTTGSNRVGDGTQVGTRKAVTFADLVKAKLHFDKNNIPATGRYMLMNPELHQDLVNIGVLQTNDMIQGQAFTSGAVGKVLGFEIFMRSETPKYDNAWTSGGTAYGLLAEDAISVSAGTYNNSIMCYHKDFVRKAKGTTGNSGVELFINERSALYQSNLMSALTRVGATKSYLSKIGVYQIIEAQ